MKNKLAHYFVSVIVPLNNDGDILYKFFNELYKIIDTHYENYELVFIDDGSSDNTPKLMSELLKKHECIRYIRLSREFGVETAISAGLDTVIGDAIVIMQPETDPPALIPQIIAEIRRTGGVVYGIQNNRTKYLPLYYRLGKWIFYKISKKFLEYQPPEDAGYFIALSRQTLNAVVQIKDKSKFLRIFSSRIGFNKTEICYNIVPMRKKLRKKKLSKAIRYGIDAITTNSTQPLRMLSYIGFFAALINIAYILYIFGVALFNNYVVEGWITTSLQSSAMFFVLFVILTVLCEYVARLIEETKNQPAYYILEEKNSSVMISNEYMRRNVLRESE